MFERHPAVGAARRSCAPHRLAGADQLGLVGIGGGLLLLIVRLVPNIARTETMIWPGGGLTLA